MLRAGGAEIKTNPSSPPRSFAWEGSSLPTDGPTIRPLSKWSPVLKAKRGICRPPDKLVDLPHMAHGLERRMLGMKWLSSICNFGRC